MAIAHDSAAAPEGKRRNWASDNPAVRAVGRIPLPLGAKLLAGFALVAVLLALVAVLGLVSLGQSNTRGKQLQSLRQQTAYQQQLLADAVNFETIVANRVAYGAACRCFIPNLGPNAAFQVLDQDISTIFQRLTEDFGLTGGFGTPAQTPLRRWAPAATRRMQKDLNTFHDQFLKIELLDQEGKAVSSDTLSDLEKVSAQPAIELTALQTAAGERASALVARNDSSFSSSRDLLIAIGAGSLALAIAVALLLSWSVVTPLRRTESRLDEIAAGEFSGRLEVANRDEIGALAARVNRMSDELRRVYRELEVASQHKSDFLTTMSHELRTPLNAVIGFSEVLQEQMFGELNERQLAYVNDILDAGRHLLSLINDVLDLAKIEAGRMDLELSQVELPDLLRSAVSMQSERAGRGGIALALTTEPAEIEITADERRVRQIVFNLLSNAVKFTPIDGRVDVSARLDDGQVEIAVADTGPGIPAEDRETIFEEFEQTTEGKQAEGTGLGLPLSRKLVELHGGRLWVESEVGHGSTFRFTLPVEAPA
jgi:signal transduction histidine kinase